eukprot:CAMPEP_0174983050 /NCGR_PEP_ID=MMETSP0004_2-20121128/16897_1 /TAXON_ID=420556 /ORGANISM="Ochromonas sp., Strain CCMP1393" /LENGTH=447 /DNA_ID=CAMNT_0016235197 /DNA_START=254 /DNA_END=1597 /DNA_ORIENTATION=-
MTSTQFRMIKSLRLTIKTITGERGGLSQIDRDHHLNGSFKQLCNKRGFTEILFPGTSKEVLDDLPKNLKEVLEWEDLELDLNKISKNAADVLESIKNKGRSQGDIMDETTESVLLPQIGQEALAKGIIEGVRRLSRRVSQMSARINQVIASPSSQQASMDQIDDEVLQSLLGGTRVGIQREYLGEEWSNLIRNDILRYIRNEKMTVVNKDGGVAPSGDASKARQQEATQMCWIESSSALVEQYPAVTQLIKHVHALPYELNLKWGTTGPVQLLEPAKGCTMLLYYPRGSSQMPRVDSRDDGSDLDSGIRITSTYILTAEPISSTATGAKASSSNTSNSGSGSSNSSGFAEDVGTGAGTGTGSDTTAISNGREMEIDGHEVHDDVTSAVASVGGLNFYDPASGARLQNVPIVDDTLVLHQATKVRNEKTPATCGYFVLIFFMQGKQEE